MKKARLFVSASLVLLSSFAQAQAPLWVQTNGPSGRWISAINFDSSGNVYVIADNLYRSGNDGASWQIMPQAPFSLSTLPNGDLLGMFDSSLRISKDNGQNWKIILNFVQHQTTVAATGTLTGNIFFAGKALLRSSDEGGHWDTLPPPPSGYNIRSFYTNTLFLFGAIDPYRSTDGGESWTKMVNGLTNDLSDISGGIGGKMLAISEGCYQSSDDGRTWKMIPGEGHEGFVSFTNNGPVAALYGLEGVEVFNQMVILAKTISNGLFTVSSNIERATSAFGTAPNGKVWLAIGSTLFKINPSSDTAFTNVSLPTAGVKYLTALSAGRVIATSGLPTGGWPGGVSLSDFLLYNTSDTGSTWHGMTGTDYFSPLSLDSDKILLGGNNLFQGYPNSVMFSSNEGVTWNPLGSPLTSTPLSSIVVGPNGNIYMGCGEGVFRSTDKGSTWDQLNSGITNQQIQSLAVSQTGEIFAGTSTALYHSSDLALNWEELPFTPPDTSGIFSLTINTAGDLLAAVHNAGVFWSHDDGKTWSPIGTGLTGKVNAMFSTPSGHVFAGTTTGVFYMPMGGGSWVNASPGLGTISVLSITRDPNGTVYLGTDGAGVFRSTQTYNSIKGAGVGPAPSLAEALSLGEVHPNPLQNTGTFLFSIPKVSHVRVDLLNTLGEKVKLIADSTFESGSYQLGIDTHGLPIGVYYLMLTTGGAVKTEKVVIAR